MEEREFYPFAVTTFYNFSPLTEDQLGETEGAIAELSVVGDLRGLLISAREGLNATFSGSDETIQRLKETVRGVQGFEQTVFKDSRARKQPFRRFKIKRRKEIVTLHRPDFVPQSPFNNHLSPEEWERVLQEEDVVVIDTRNGYEVALGKFSGAIDPEMHMFSEFGEFLDRAQIPKEKKVLMYCTGGIRCEKAILEMQDRGYDNVFQLEGGILNYLQKFPNSQYEGECFVFDHRVAVDQELKPSQRFSLCPHCGDPGETVIHCSECDKTAIICEECAELPDGSTCSKNCAYHQRVKGEQRLAS